MPQARPTRREVDKNKRRTLRLSEVPTVYGISVDTVSRAIDRAELPSYQLGKGTHLVYVDDVDTWIKARPYGHAA